MITINQEDREERRKFLNMAVKYFERDLTRYTCTRHGMNEGDLCAIRCGDNMEQVVIFRIAAEDVELYPNVIKIEEA